MSASCDLRCGPDFSVGEEQPNARLPATPTHVELYFYDGWQNVEEYLASNTASPNKQYVYGEGIDEVLRATLPDAADLDGDLDTSELVDLYYHHNSIGSVAAVTDAAGNVVESYTYRAYGEVTSRDASLFKLTTTAVEQPFMFTGRRLDFEEASGLLYYRLRYYDPAVGRFVSRDPLGMWGDPGQRGNAQSYCGNNPVNRVDPWGLDLGTGPGVDDSGPSTFSSPLTVSQTQHNQQVEGKSDHPFEDALRMGVVLAGSEIAAGLAALGFAALDEALGIALGWIGREVLGIGEAAAAAEEGAAAAAAERAAADEAAAEVAARQTAKREAEEQAGKLAAEQEAEKQAAEEAAKRASLKDKCRKLKSEEEEWKRQVRDAARERRDSHATSRRKGHGKRTRAKEARKGEKRHAKGDRKQDRRDRQDRYRDRREEREK